jgi:hypothetical protein
VDGECVTYLLIDWELLQAPARSDEEKQLRQYQKELYDEWVVQDQQLK